jgi:hypothetical protein
MHSEILKQKKELENDICILQNCSNILLSSSEGLGLSEVRVKLDGLIAVKVEKLEKLEKSLEKSLEEWQVLEEMTSRK